MSTFKSKTNKIRGGIIIETVDSYHSMMTKKFNEEESKLENYKDELKNLNNELNNATDNIKINKIKKKIQKIKLELKLKDGKKDELDYYSQTGDLLMTYYGMFSNQTTDNEFKQDDHIHVDTSKLVELENLSNKKKNKKIKKKNKNNVQKKNGLNNIMNYFSVKDEDNDDEIEVNRASILNEYLSLLECKGVSERELKKTEYECSKCNIIKKIIPAEGLCICEKCGEAEELILEIDRTNMKDQSPEKSGYPYKRINHFNEWLSQFQAKESAEIPDEVYNMVIKELKKRRIYDLNSLNLMLMKDILKTLKLNDFYEHTPYIISKINKLPPPTISRQKEEQLKKLFKKMQEPFNRHKPKTRKNFLSYSYVLHKLCELLEMDNFVKCFPLLKNRNKLRDQDSIWKKICKDCGWEFYPSV